MKFFDYNVERVKWLRFMHRKVLMIHNNGNIIQVLNYTKIYKRISIASEA